ncbi:thioredoxin family protein [Cryobacterium sp. TMT1-21]|uniref:Thioredoxin family protein n=1 Tax=Cryobacterium shii TaxID=1259235 RepID=A0AAQ2HEE3_9MICO|nr:MULTISPECIES: glutaredoxin family protein [Cryobacterium]TFC41779.1 thioredoxin family protein [Cryobacterium shii]TFC84472.1 thioredoxin family protein [Cryobacterium sp. TmT2-59]TFD15382.1 thioredoxin family protein [Cryobacterium sp. TMT4-10]TFD17538.1 thioredoxin family protein [Cryobacterium sp. TMT1-21]TFD22011.1 thioredoxin family protein [Cryobacterium sp. TMT2-23]
MIITILTQASCPSCDQAKLVLSRLARDHPFEVLEIGLGTDEGRGLAVRHGVAFAPGVLIDGVMFSYGRLSEKKLARHLSQHPTAAESRSGTVAHHNRQQE